MLLSHKYKFIFVHIQKTGGTSVATALRPYCEEQALAQVREAGLTAHSGAEQIVEALGRNMWDEYTTFCFDRNPWAKCLSLYFYQLQYWDRYRKPFRPRQPTFRQWFYPFGVWSKKLKPSFAQYSIGQELAVDYLGKYENLQEDFARVCQQIGLPDVRLPHRNKSKMRTTENYRGQYTSSMRRRVGRVFHREIELLDYSF